MNGLTQQFKVETESEKQRLDHYLNKKLTDVSRSQIKKLIKGGFVLVNEETPSVHQFLKGGDIITVTEPEPKEAAPIPEIPLAQETDQYVVINKPAGVLTHPTEHGQPTPAVSDWFKATYPDSADVGDPDRPGVVHRLDRDTSGLLVLAKTPEMFEHLKTQFHNRKVTKTYIALVHGNLPEESGEIEKPIGRSKQHGRMAARAKKEYQTDRDAKTAYTVIRSYQKYDLVKAIPLTGRTHQIRVHFHSIGHPVAGDPLYKINGQKTDELSRLFLHASELSFTDLDGETVSFEADLPSDLQTILASLK